MIWRASWIWCTGDKSPVNFFLYARKKIRVAEKPIKFTARVCADSRYKLYVNGKYAGRGPARSAPQWQAYDVHDLAAMMRPGENVIAALVYHDGGGNLTYNKGRGGFIFQGELSGKDGRKTFVNTDGTWKVKNAVAWKRDVPRLTHQIGFQEHYDANAAIEGWESIGFDDSGWEAPVVIGRPPVKPWIRMLERDIPPLRETEVFPVSIVEIGEIPKKTKRYPSLVERIASEPHRKWKRKPKGIENILKDNIEYCALGPASEDIYMIIDFGREVIGYPRIFLEGQRGGIIDFAYDELLLKGRVNPRRTYPRIQYHERYIMRDGKQSFEHAFSLKGFRYLQIMLRNITQPIKFYKISLNFVTYPVKYLGSFHSSDPLLNKIWEVSRYTLELCMHDAYLDCPWREQGQYMGDARLEILANYYAFGDFQLAAKTLRQIAQSQGKDGMVMCLYPGQHSDVILSFCLFWIIALHDYYFYSGDTKLPGELYSPMVKMLKGFGKFLSADGLLDMPKTSEFYLHFFDWHPALTGHQGEMTLLNALFHRALVCAAALAETLEKESEASAYRALADKVKRAINARLWSEKRGLFAENRVNGKKTRVFSQQANTLASLFDIAAPERKTRVFSNIFDKKVIKITTPYFMFYLCEALLKSGRHQAALRIIRDRWGMMLARGATAFWEMFKGLYLFFYFRGYKWRKIGTLCHGWAGGPLALLAHGILGIRPIKPGFAEFSVDPDLGNLTSASGAVPTPHGIIRIALKKGAGGILRGVLEHPAGTQPKVMNNSVKLRISRYK